MNIDDIKAQLARLQAAMARRDRAGVNAACAALVAGRAPLGKQWKALATVAQHNGEALLARRIAELWASQAANDPVVRVEAAAIMAQSGALDRALALIEALPRDRPDPLGNRYLRAMLSTNLGRTDAARDLLREAVTIAPTAGQAWLALAMLGPLSDEDGRALDAASAAARRAAAPDFAQFLYALGRWRDQQGEHDAAFAAFAEGAKLARKAEPYQHAVDVRDAEDARSGWSAASLATEGQTQSGDPIFVTGLPRSGTTLVEQILASHSAVGGGEEIGLFRILEQEVGGKSAAAFAQFGSRGGSADGLAALYRRLRSERAPDPRAFVDKTLSASRHVGLMRQAFPTAPLVWLRRDPLDVAWSAYRTWFSRGLSWSWSLTDIAAHMRLEDQLLAHWHDLLGDTLLIVDYAELVADPEPAIARIDAHCGLDLEPQQLTPHKTKRTVTTASVSQVRRPINRDAIGAAAPYRRHLTPFIDAYTKAGGVID